MVGRRSKMFRILSDGMSLCSDRTDVMLLSMDGRYRYRAEAHSPGTCVADAAWFGIAGNGSCELRLLALHGLAEFVEQHVHIAVHGLDGVAVGGRCRKLHRIVVLPVLRQPNPMSLHVQRQPAALDKSLRANGANVRSFAYNKQTDFKHTPQQLESANSRDGQGWRRSAIRPLALT